MSYLFILLVLLCIIGGLAMIRWRLIFKTLGILIIFILVVYCLLPEETSESLPEWIKTIVAIAAYIAFIVIYAILSIFGMLSDAIRRILNLPDCKRTTE